MKMMTISCDTDDGCQTDLHLCLLYPLLLKDLEQDWHIIDSLLLHCLSLWDRVTCLFNEAIHLEPVKTLVQ